MSHALIHPLDQKKRPSGDDPFFRPLGRELTARDLPLPRLVSLSLWPSGLDAPPVWLASLASRSAPVDMASRWAIISAFTRRESLT